MALVDLAIANSRRQIPIADKRVAHILANIEDVFQLAHLTVICTHCGGTPVGRNHPTDEKWKLECACSTRHLVNPDVQRITKGLM